MIQPSQLPWSSPAITVPKKNGEVRLCVDFRSINRVTLPVSYPLPRIDELLAAVSNATYLTSLGLTQGYHQVKLSPETVPKTAFTTHCGKFEYTRLPFGLCNAPSHFQHCMDQTFSDLNAKAYIDDAIIASASWEEHLSTLKAVFKRCQEKNIALKLSKCCFASASLDYLGHTVSSWDR